MAKELGYQIRDDFSRSRNYKKTKKKKEPAMALKAKYLG